jgi:hypothetical protein
LEYLLWYLRYELDSFLWLPFTRMHAFVFPFCGECTLGEAIALRLNS